MRQWNNRSPEVAYLLNPAFCARVIYGVIFSYQKESQRKFPLVLAYLVLPIILHKYTRERISSRTYMQVWLQRNPEVLIGFARRAKSLTIITNEAIEFLLQSQIIAFDAADIEITKPLRLSKQKCIDDPEILECFAKAEPIGKWFARAGAVENIYVGWGVRP
ncbi:MAG: three component ABC system middle component [Christensenellaceae bacterium]